MSKENPYAEFLAGQDPVKVLPLTAQKIEAMFNELGAEQVNKRPGPGKWCAREIVCHLADCELVFGFRLRQALAEDHHTLQPFDQEKWAVNYEAYGVQDALATFQAVRNWNLALIRSVPPEAHAKRVTHPERGSMSFSTIVETMGGHDINHLRQLDAIAKKFALQESAAPASN